MSVRKSEALALTVVSGINLAMARLADIWNSIGIMEDQRMERMLTVKKHIEGLMNEMISEEENLKRSIQNSITTFQKQLEILSLEMSVEPFELEDNLTVLQTEKNLRLQVEALQKARSERLKEARGLQRQDEELCEALCATPYYLPAGGLPSVQQLQELRQHIHDLTQEKRSRVAVFSGLREEIRIVMAKMGHEPETSLEKEAMCDDTDVFLLTHDNIKALQLLLCQLELKKKSLTALRDELEGKVVRFWTRLEIPGEELQRFRDNLPSTLSDEIAQWQTEVDRLSVLQAAKLEEVIVKMRQELLELWDRCMFGPKQREPFDAHFCSGNFTEELLSHHDQELLRLKAFYETARSLLETVDRWNRNWALFQDFEKKASDPNRFSNRGGALLKEAKERVRVQKLLPKLEEDLRTGVQAWERDHGTVFLVWGERATDRVTRLWEEHQLQRSQQKTERISKKGDSTPLKSQPKRPQAGASSGPTPCKMRKHLQASNQTVVRVNSVGSSSSSNSCAASTFLSVSAKAPTPSQKSQPKNRTLDVTPRMPLQEFNSENKHMRIGSYSEFTSELSRKVSGDAVLNSTTKDIH